MRHKVQAIPNSLVLLLLCFLQLFVMIVAAYHISITLRQAPKMKRSSNVVLIAVAKCLVWFLKYSRLFQRVFPKQDYKSGLSNTLKLSLIIQGCESLWFRKL